MARVILALGLLLSSLMVSAQGLGPIPIPDRPELDRRIELVSQEIEFDVDLKVERQEKEYRFSQRTLTYTNPHSRSERQLLLDFYIPNGAELRALPTIVLFPSLRGLTRFDTGYAKAFAKNGFVAVISHVVDDINELNTPQQVARAFQYGVQDNVLLVDYLHEVEYVQPHRIGTFGLSVGGIRAALTHGIDNRLLASGIVVGAGNVAGIITHSVESRVTAMRERIQRNIGNEDPRRFERLMRQNILFDPIFFATYNNEERPALVIIGTKDEKVPARYQEEYLSYFERAEDYRYPLGHNATAMAVLGYKKPVIDFFEENLLGFW